MTSRFETRTCRDGGWDNHLPVCEGTEKVACSTLKNEWSKVGFHGRKCFGSPKDLSVNSSLKVFLSVKIMKNHFPL